MAWRTWNSDQIAAPSLRLTRPGTMPRRALGTNAGLACANVHIVGERRAETGVTGPLPVLSVT